MPRFKIIITETTYASIIVEAESKEEVEEKIECNDYEEEIRVALGESCDFETDTEVEEL